MASYKKISKDVIKKADIILEVVDARFPDETRNSEVERDIARAKKPFIIVLNKCDLVSKDNLEKTKSRLSKIAPTVFMSSKDRSGTTILRHKILETANKRGGEILVSRAVQERLPDDIETAPWRTVELPGAPGDHELFVVSADEAV